MWSEPEEPSNNDLQYGEQLSTSHKAEFGELLRRFNKVF